MKADRAEAAFWAAFLRNRNVEAGTAADGAVAVAGGYAVSIAGTYYQMALAAGSTRPLTADDLAVLAAFYGDRGAPVCLEVREEVLERDRPLLEAAGYTFDERPIALLEAPAAKQPPNASFVVRSTNDRTGWAEVASTCFDIDSATSAIHLRSALVGAAAASALFVAHVDGVTAGVGALGIAGDIAFLYSGAVLPAYRGRGLHAALLRTRLAFAATRGATRAALKARIGSASERSALRAGFARTATLRRAHAG